jgi:hypothetical protein
VRASQSSVSQETGFPFSTAAHAEASDDGQWRGIPAVRLRGIVLPGLRVSEGWGRLGVGGEDR